MMEAPAPLHSNLEAAFAALMASGLEGAGTAPGNLKQLAGEFLAAKPDGLKFLLGRNEHSAALVQSIAVDGIVDDFSPGKLWNGKPVIKCDDIPKDAIVVNCSMSISPISAGRRLQKLGLKGCIRQSLFYRKIRWRKVRAPLGRVPGNAWEA